MRNDEHAKINFVVTRLAASHPETPFETVAATVTRIHDRLSKAAVRDYLPALVEHCAERELSGIPPRRLRSL
ncbi:three-helix bundle dimerization domain-containing protein [Nocardia wallacei]|uniref:three-helix bundle dimerization domain-containing protein n=1 Tax=Nocardia wallacei TaxID=480035 RepID=UPI003CC7D346